MRYLGYLLSAYLLPDEQEGELIVFIMNNAGSVWNNDQQTQQVSMVWYSISRCGEIIELMFFTDIDRSIST